jgi:hypothetical protein
VSEVPVTLDVAAIAEELRRLAQEAASDERAGWRTLEDAVVYLDEADLRVRLCTAKTSWLLARATESYRATVPLPTLPGSYSVVATDGSLLNPDRHSPLRYYVINLGGVVLAYGERSDARLKAEARLYAGEDELYIVDRSRKVPVSGAVLGFRRAVDELRHAVELAKRAERPVVVLQDGTLILWGLESQPEFVTTWVLQPFLAALAELRSARIPVAGFISYPGSSDVMNALRVSVCDYPARGLIVNCDHCRARIVSEGHRPACDVLPDVPDRALFESVLHLPSGARSSLFASSSTILERYPDDDRIHFFYVHTGTEVARVEVPAWVGRDPVALNLLHATVIDQCTRARGYPLALQEAHELAVIRSEERRAVEMLLDRHLAEYGVVLRRSAKDRSKRGRYV